MNFNFGTSKFIFLILVPARSVLPILVPTIKHHYKNGYHDMMVISLYATWAKAWYHDYVITCHVSIMPCHQCHVSNSAMSTKMLEGINEKKGIYRDINKKIKLKRTKNVKRELTE